MVSSPWFSSSKIAPAAQDSESGCGNPDDLSSLASASTACPATSECGSDRLSRVIAQLNKLKVAGGSRAKSNNDGERDSTHVVNSDGAAPTKSPAQRLRDYLNSVDSTKRARLGAVSNASSPDCATSPTSDEKVVETKPNPYVLPEHVFCLKITDRNPVGMPHGIQHVNTNPCVYLYTLLFSRRVNHLFKPQMGFNPFSTH